MAQYGMSGLTGGVSDAGRPVGADGRTPADRREYRWNLLSAIVLSLATLAAAWAGFQAAAWNSVYSNESRTATGERFEAARQAALGDRQLISDVMIFSTWLQAEVEEDQELATEIQARFRPHFVPVFEAWLKQPVPEGARLPDGTPFDLPEYVLPSQAATQAANDRASAALDAADEAGAASSRYVLISVLFASVLFLAGIASKLDHPRMAHAVVAIAALALLAALWLMFTSPIRI